jgi:hypothetical protein
MFTSATFRSSHIRPIDASLRRELLLRKAGALTVLVQGLAKALEDLGSGEGARQRIRIVISDDDYTYPL